ncbi:MAG: hypothetical protein U0M39_03600, partial [Oscillospiraceae bacterium]|nr:hypothetical protein [Oscillospiraceae bacterium]
APQANPAFPIWSCGTLHRSFSFVPEASHTLRSVADARELFVRTVLFLIQRIIPKMQKAPSLKTERLASRE